MVCRSAGERPSLASASWSGVTSTTGIGSSMSRRTHVAPGMVRACASTRFAIARSCSTSSPEKRASTGASDDWRSICFHRTQPSGKAFASLRSYSSSTSTVASSSLVLTMSWARCRAGIRGSYSVWKRGELVPTNAVMSPTRGSFWSSCSTRRATASVSCSGRPGGSVISTANWARSTFGKSCWGVCMKSATAITMDATPIPMVRAGLRKARSSTASYTRWSRSSIDGLEGLALSARCRPWRMKRWLRMGTSSAATTMLVMSAVAMVTGRLARKSPP